MNKLMEENCVFQKANVHQRGHTCWFDTAVITLANTSVLHDHNASDVSDHKKRFRNMISRPSLSRDIEEHAGISDYAKKLHERVSAALGEDICPMKSSSGNDMMGFLKALLNHVDISFISMKVPSISNTPVLLRGKDTITCENIGTVDIDVFVEESLGKAISKHPELEDEGVLLVESRGSDSNCLKLDCSSRMNIETHRGTYVLTLKTMTISNHGHVMAMGRCRSDNEWTVFDNEFSGLGFSPRTFSGDTFDRVKDQMYMFPHTYFDPKNGPVPMNPFFKMGSKSSTVFVYDYVRFED